MWKRLVTIILESILGKFYKYDKGCDVPLWTHLLPLQVQSPLQKLHEPQSEAKNPPHETCVPETRNIH